MQEVCDSGIHIILRGLIAHKSKRDRTNFTVYQLAKAINMPHSILVKLLHTDPAKRVSNPRLDTLLKIVDFFRADGFDVTLDSFFVSPKPNGFVEVLKQDLPGKKTIRIVPLYSMTVSDRHSLGKIEVALDQSISEAIAFVSDTLIEPMFKAGSTFVVDVNCPAVDGALVAAELHGHEKILIGKFLGNARKAALETFGCAEPSPIISTRGDKIVGVVIQVNTKT